MIQDPTVGLRNAMAAVGLYPGDIVWDGAFHRFPGAGKKDSNTSGWYKAFPDRKGAVFGDHASVPKVHWKADRSSEPTKSMRAIWAEEDARRKKERAAASEKAIEEATAVWNNAVTEPAEVLGHPYLKEKEIESCERLRISRETELDGWTLPAGILLIPMLVDKKLVNLQRITRDGQKLYWPKAPASGASLIIGGKYFREDTTKTIYVAEGWATAWTVSEATKSPCMVAFSKDGLLPVAKKVKERFPAVRGCDCGGQRSLDGRAAEGRAAGHSEPRCPLRDSSPPRNWAARWRSPTSTTCRTSPPTSMTCGSRKAWGRCSSGSSPTTRAGRRSCRISPATSRPMTTGTPCG